MLASGQNWVSLKQKISIRFLQNCYVIILGTLFKTVAQDVILIGTALKNVNTDELALVIEKVVLDLNKYDLLQLTKTFNLHNNNLGSKSKRHLKKIIEDTMKESWWWWPIRGY